MGQRWTEEQRAAITLRDRSILVSAAAGSGKTAVLVERIIQRICDEAEPADIDRLLVVTFTRAAAMQMRERIRKALQAKLEREPANRRLSEQLALVPYAQITTIDSFCRSIVMDYFHMIPELDPGFRIADEGECRLMREDTLEELIEAAYERPTAEFQALTAAFSNTRGDAQIRDMVLRLYSYAATSPFPEEWLRDCLRQFALTDAAALEETPWCAYVREDIAGRLAGICEGCRRLVEMCRGAEVPEAYAGAFSLDCEGLSALHTAVLEQSLWTALAKLSAFTWQRKPVKKKTDVVSEQAAARVEAVRKGLKDELAKIVKLYCTVSGAPDNGAAVLREIGICRPYAEGLIGLTLAFSKAYAACKRKKNVVDFYDIEHFALRILIKERRADGGLVLSDAALHYQNQFCEIMVDEYQDSNLVQEYILLAVSGELTGRPNLFMVGDVKQSIYRFRMARPQLFMQKYASFTAGESLHQKIELQKNFRSREQVLESINRVFYEIMRQDLGGIDYHADNALNTGKQYPEAPREDVRTAVTDLPEGAANTELWLLDIAAEQTSVSPEDGEADGEAEAADSGATRIEWEARLAARRIAELTDRKDGMQIWDEDAECYRPLRYGDILVLLRTVSGWSDTFVQVLGEYGIPAVCESRQGYFQAYEIKTLLNMLRIVDNPHQDIPLLAVLRSPFGGFGSEELAQIRIFGNSLAQTDGSGQRGKPDYYRTLTAYAAHMNMPEGNNALGEKAARFLERLRDYREAAVCLSIHDLLVKILRDTRFDVYAASMPAGDMRAANIDILLKKTVEFENTSYSGLFQFIRYVEQLEKYEIEMAPPASSAQEHDAVHIMSIHKSKGLEYPVVLLAGCGKQFNSEDYKRALCVDEDFGMALSCIDTKKHMKYPSFMKAAFSQKRRNEALGEELRILYVAMTRAKELLIMTAAATDMSKRAERIINSARLREADSRTLSYISRSTAGCYLDWLLAVCAGQPLFAQTAAQMAPEGGYIPHGDGQKEQNQLQTHYIRSEELLLARISQAEETASGVKRLHDLEEAAGTETGSAGSASGAEAGQSWARLPEKIRELFRQRYEFVYPYRRELEMRANISVSDLKHEAIERLNEEEGTAAERIVFATDEEDSAPKTPAFMRQESQGVPAGALRGSAYHAVLERLDFTDERTDCSGVSDMIREIVETGTLSEAEAKLVSAADIAAFLDSGLGQRMRRAAKAGRLHKEEQFILGLTPEEKERCQQYSMYGGENRKEEIQTLLPQGAGPEAAKADSYIMVQGIIDAYFEEDGRCILMDYKTDRVSKENGETELIRRYYTQMFYYDLALRRMRGREVGEWWIYSFCLKKAIRVR